MFGLLNLGLFIVKRFIIWVIVGTTILMSVMFFQVNQLRDAELPVTVSRMESNFPASFIGTGKYWSERTKWYKYGCMKDSDHCGDNTRFTHEQYMNARYDNVYKRIARHEKGNSFSILDFLSIR